MQNVIPNDVEALFRALALESATDAMRKGNLTLAIAIVDQLAR